MTPPSATACTGRRCPGFNEESLALLRELHALAGTERTDDLR